MADIAPANFFSCQLCGNTQDLRRCAKCKQIYYCSKQHQKQDWKVHKKICVVSMVENEVIEEKVAFKIPKASQNSHPEIKESVSDAKSNTFQTLEDESNVLNRPEEGNSVPVSKLTTGETHEMPSQEEETYDPVSSNEQKSEESTLKSTTSEGAPVLNLTETEASVSVSATNEAPSDENVLNLPNTENSVSQSTTDETTLQEQVLNHPNKDNSSKSCRTEAKEDDEHVFNPAPFIRSEFPQPDSRDPITLSEFASEQLKKDGYCIIDNVLPGKECDNILKEITELNANRLMTSGKLEGGRASGNEKEMKVNKEIRSDEIMWLNGTEEDEYPAICKLVSETMDAVVGGMNAYLDESIHGRTKAMAACYPGGGSSYHKHIDNPRKDGRLITCIMYLNKDWDVQKSGGFLRIYPSSKEPAFVDVEPIMNRLLLFWSDCRNPHAVHPAHDTRYAVTVWYFDKEERAKAKADMATEELSNLQEQLMIMDLQQKTMEKDLLAQKVENESQKALSVLNDGERDAIFAMMSLYPDPMQVLQHLGIAPSIQKILLQQYNNRMK